MKYHDPFLFNSIEKIVSVEFQDTFALIELSDTIFYPGGGGQPKDHGTITLNENDFEVIDVIKQDSKILHKIKLQSQHNVNFTQGADVELRINKNRRKQLVRMHTGEHLFMGSLIKNIPDVNVEKINLDEEESSLFIIPPKNKEITWQDIFKAEEITNNIIQQNRTVLIHLVNKEDVQTKFPKARIKLERIKSDNVRIIEIQEHDYSACAGIHCTTTNFIGNFIVTKFNKVKDKYEIKFKVNSLDTLFELSKYSRELSSLLKVNPKEIFNFSSQLLKEKEELKEKLRKSFSAIKIETNNQEFSDIVLRSTEIKELDKKQTGDKLNEMFEEFDETNKKKQILILFKKNDKGLQFSMRISKSLGDVSEMIKELKIKGGGRDTYASGMCENKTDFLIIIKKYFDK